MSQPNPSRAHSFDQLFGQGCAAIRQRNWRRARGLFRRAVRIARERSDRLRARNATAVSEAMLGQVTRARRGLRSVLRLDDTCVVAHENLQLLDEATGAVSSSSCQDAEEPPSARTAQRIVLLSFLFNWPSTGGGIVHTVELARFLSEAGYEIQLIHPVYPALGDRRGPGLSVSDAAGGVHPTGLAAGDDRAAVVGGGAGISTRSRAAHRLLEFPAVVGGEPERVSGVVADAGPGRLVSAEQFAVVAHARRDGAVPEPSTTQ